LDGGVIASQAAADKNRLETGTLGWRDIANASDYRGSGSVIGVSTNSVPTGGLSLSTGNNTGLTKSAISPGSIILTHPEIQEQDVSTLSRDTQHANDSVSDGFNLNKIGDRLELQRQAVSLSVQAMGAVQAKLKADKEAEISTRLSAAGLTPEQISATPEFKQIEQDYGIGGKYWTAGVSFTSALSGLLGGNVEGAAAGAAAPYLANLVKQISGGDNDNVALRTILHSALGAFLARAQGGDAVSGAAGGATAVIFTRIFYPGIKTEALTEEQKQIIDNLVVIAGSTAGGLASGSLSGVGSGANTAKNEVENNSLSAS